MKKIAIYDLLFAFLFAAASAAGFSAWTNSARADSSPHIIINEIQTAGAQSNDDFIELFNPSDAPIDLEGYKLTKKTKAGSSESTLVSTAKFSGIIQEHGYFLIAHPDYFDEISADLPYSSSSYYISSDNTVFLYNKNGTLLDEVGFGAVDYSNSETSPAPNPNATESIERKNFVDTDNNAADLSINTSPSPQNKDITEDNEEEPLGGEESPNDTEKNDDIIPDAQDICAVDSSDIKLNEIFPYPDSGEEFVEVVNTGENCADISGWKIMDEAGHKVEFPENSILDSDEYIFLEGNFYLNNDSDTVYLLGKNGSEKDDAQDSQNFEKAEKDSSYAFDGESWQWTSTPTPGGENIFDANENEENTNNSLTENVFLNEILPNPKKDSDDEYIEIANDESGPVDLNGWRLKDSIKSKGYEFKEHVFVEPGEYLAIYKPQSKLALNNSEESVFLSNPQGDIISSVSYGNSQKNASYNFDGKNWRWSKYLTPGEKNKFDSEPSVKIKKTKHVYKDVYTDFSASAKDKEIKKLKYAWDFGDGKKSNLAETSHKYLDTGKYTVTLSVSDESQTVEKSFTISVKNYPRPNLEIVKIIPNPVGADSKGEVIDLRNNSEKKVGLDGWKIATGSDEKVNNHPLSDGINLEPGGTKTITREMSRFTFGNSSGKVQLISPDGKTVDEVDYEKEKIAENEAYVKIDDNWQWISSSEKEKDYEENGNAENEPGDSVGEILGATDENSPHHTPIHTSYTSEDAYIFFNLLGLFKATKNKNCCAIYTPYPDPSYLLIASI